MVQENREVEEPSKVLCSKLKGLTCFLVSVLLPLISSSVEGHVGATVYPIYELPSADLPTFHDGTLEDWDQVLPNASLTHAEFTLTDGDRVELDDFAFRVFLAWHIHRSGFSLGSRC